jgi:DNA repair protein RecN (Recombination protein N)
MADTHFGISKAVHGERTATAVDRLSRPERIEEIGRMLGGAEVTDKTREHADEMLTLAERRRAEISAGA